MEGKYRDKKALESLSYEIYLAMEEFGNIVNGFTKGIDYNTLEEFKILRDHCDEYLTKYDYYIKQVKLDE